MNVLARRPIQIVVGVIVALALFGGGFAFGSSRAPAATAGGATGSTGTTGFRGGAGGSGANGGGAAQRRISNGQIPAGNSDSITNSLRTGRANGARPTTSPGPQTVGTG